MIDRALLTRVQEKLAAPEKAYDLPGGEWYKGLYDPIAMHQAGRAQVLAETDPKHVKKPSFNVKHPYWATGLLGGAGAIAGGALGAGAGVALGPQISNQREVKAQIMLLGTQLGAVGGALAASLALGLQRQKEIKKMSSQFTKPDPQLLQQIAEKDAKRNILWQALRSTIVGAAEAGRGSQQRALKEKGREVHSGWGTAVPPLASAIVPFGGTAGNMALGLHGRSRSQETVGQKPSTRFAGE